MHRFALLLLLSSLFLISCQGPDRGPSSNLADAPNSATGSPLVPVTDSRSGKVYRQEIAVDVTGDTMVVQVMEPTELIAGGSYPLVLQGHGYGGSRNTEPSGFQQRLRDAGYYVISIDQRGFGDSSGQVRVMDPEYEGPDLVAILDWAENLEGLMRRANGKMMVGSYGGSYGGMFQLLLHAVDPQHRLRVMAPDVTPHDLTYSLNPNGVVKSGWGLALVAGGEASIASALGPDILNAIRAQLARGGTRQDPAILEILLNAGLSGSFDESGFNFMRYHSMKYYCDGEPAGPQSFLAATADALTVAPDLPPPADILLTQGFRDTLFNFNDGLHNYECLSAIGGDVRLMTHQSGHLLPVSLEATGLEQPLDPFYQAITVPEFQGAGGSRSCGSMSLDDMQFAWFEEKLQGKAGAVDDAITTGKNVCLSLAENDAIAVKQVKRGGESFAIDAATPQLSGVLGILGSVLGDSIRQALLSNQVLFTVPDEGAIIAGVPLLNVNIEGISGAELDQCTATGPLPLPALGCDPVYFLALAHRPPGQNRWDVLDDQITPIRGFGQHELEMNGIAERLPAGEEVALLIYGFHAQFPISWSRDLLVPAATFSGHVQVPLLSSDEVVQDDV